MSTSQLYVGNPCGVVLCIDGRNRNYKVTGRIYHGYRLEAIEFNGMAEAILYMERFYDEMRYPFPGTTTRHFGNVGEPVVIPYKTARSQRKKRSVSDSELLNHKGKKASFIVRVEQRQHSSWQGRVTWMERGETAVFRSVLELLKLLDQAMDQNEGIDHRADSFVNSSKEEMEAI